MNYIFSQQLERWDDAHAHELIDHYKYRDTILDMAPEFADKAEKD